MRKILPILLILLFGLVGVGFIFSRSEDTWICENGEWVKYGNPSTPMPEGGCGTEIMKETKEKLEDMSVCVSPDGVRMNYSDAELIAEKNCLGGSLKEEHFCNDYTGTWWIDFAPNEPKEGCNPACVVDIENKTAEINWRCTGLIEKN
jgi:hypothetical protein